MGQEHVCVIREEIEAAEQELERDLHPDDVVDFDVALRIFLLKRFASPVIVPLPEFELEPVSLHDKFTAWLKARIALDEAERDLHGRDALDELIQSKRQLERYLQFLRNHVRNAIEIAQEVREMPRLAAILADLKGDVLESVDAYASGGGSVPYIVLSVFEYSRFLKATL